MKKILKNIVRGALLLSLIIPSAGVHAESETVYWINPDGGLYYHLDQNCLTIHPKYLPLRVSITEEELKQLPPDNSYFPCSVCISEDNASIPEEIRETGTPPEEPAWEMIIDPQYAEYALTNRYIREAPVFIDRSNMLAKAETDAQGYTNANHYLQWYRDGKLYREVECKYRETSRWLFEGVFLVLPDGAVGLASVRINALVFYRWDENGMTEERSIPGVWQDVRGNTAGFCATRKDEDGLSAHLFDSSGNEIWSYDFDQSESAAKQYAYPIAADGADTYLLYVKAGGDLYAVFCVRDGKMVWRQNLMYSGNAFFAGDQTFILAEVTSNDDLYADILLDHRDADGKSLGTKRLSGDRVVKSIRAIRNNPETGGYTVYGSAVANSRGVYTVFRMELDNQMNQQSISVRDFDFHQEYNFSVVTVPEKEAYVYCRAYDESYVQPVLVPFDALPETDEHGLRIH